MQRDGGEREGDAYKRADGGERGEHRTAQQHMCIGFTHVFHQRFQLFKNRRYLYHARSEKTIVVCYKKREGLGSGTTISFGHWL